MKPLAATPHGVLDYTVGLFLVMSPWLFRFSDVSTGATVTMLVMGAIVLILSAITDYPLGLLKLVPFPTHGVIEAFGAVFLMASPWIVRYTAIPAARNIALVVALAWLVVVSLTNYSTFQTRRPVH